jgi:hypothetical protein
MKISVRTEARVMVGNVFLIQRLNQWSNWTTTRDRMPPARNPHRINMIADISGYPVSNFSIT